MKKYITAVFSALLILALAGCGGGASPDGPSALNGGSPSPEDIEEMLQNIPDVLDGDWFWHRLPEPEVSHEPVDLPHTGELVLYIPSWTSYGLTPVIDLYKRLYPDVNLIIERIGEGNAWGPEYSTRLNTELMAGRGPDIIFPGFMDGNTDIAKMAETGVFLDLNKIIEKDKGFDFDAYIKPVLDGGIFHNGSRYIMPYSYSVPFYLASTDIINEIGFTVSPIGDTVSFINEIVRVLPKARENPNFRTMFNNVILYDLIEASGIRLVDYENNTVLPGEDELREFMHAYKPYYHMDFNTDLWIHTDNVAHIVNGAIIFERPETIYGFHHFADQLKSGFEILGVPGMDGKTYAASHDSVAIRAGARNQLNAWNFIKLLLSPEYQSTSSLTFMPVHRNSLFSFIEHIDTFTDFSLSREDINAYVDMITDIDYFTVYQSRPARRMLFQHMTPFFEGERSWEDAIEGLRSQLRIYISE